MAKLSDSILELPEVMRHFQVVQRPFGETLLHKSLPIWITEYAAFPGMKPPQPRHWQVYYARGTSGRDPVD